MGNKKLYSSQLLVIGFSILEIIATFLPAAKVYGQTFNLISPGGHMGSGVFFIYRRRHIVDNSIEHHLNTLVLICRPACHRDYIP